MSAPAVEEAGLVIGSWPQGERPGRNQRGIFPEGVPRRTGRPDPGFGRENPESGHAHGENRRLRVLRHPELFLGSTETKGRHVP